MDLTETFEELFETIQDTATVESVYGDPIERDDVTLVPVAKVAYGGGSGFGSDGDEDGGQGGGFGGGVTATPVGVLEIADGHATFRTFRNRRRLGGVLLVGLLLGLLLGRRSSVRT